MAESTSSLRFDPLQTEILVGEAKRGKQEAWSEIYQRYRKMLIAQIQVRFGFARRRFDAEDVLHDAVRRALGGIHGFEYSGEGSFRRWLTTIVLNEVARALARSPEHSLTESTGPPELVRKAEQEEELSQNKAHLWEALGKLDEDDRDLLIQHVIEERTFEEIALAMDWKRESARRAFMQALARLQGFMRG